MSFRPKKGYRDRRSGQFRSIEEKYSLFQADEGTLKAALENISITAQPVAVPISATTRGVGLAVALSYDRSCTTWSVEEISSIATIHQVYRVALYCFHYKLYKAQQKQLESVSVVGAFRRITIPDEIRELMQLIGKVPAAVALVLDCVGRIEHEGSIWHIGYPDVTDSEDTEWTYLTINPDTIRDTLLAMSTTSTSLPQRTAFIRNNPIPGARFENDLLVNADQIWPADYEANSILKDIHAFKMWINRVEMRLPKHSFPNLNWSGLTSAGGLVSSEGGAFRIESQFNTFNVYQRSKVYGEITDFWVPNKIETIDQIMGSASLVGEVCWIETRHETNAREKFSRNPVNTMSYICHFS